MDTRPGDELRAALQSTVAVLNVNRYGAVLGDAGLAASAPGGPPHLVRLVVTLEHVALAMQFRARGRLLEAWAACLVAAASLPSSLRQDTAAGARAQLTSEPATGEVDAYLSWWASRLVFREQYELGDLRRRFTHDRATPREELIEVYIEYLATGRATDCSRSAFLARATRLRHFAGSRRGDVSQSVWTDVGGLDGLHAAALDNLAALSAPTPWWGQHSTADLPVGVDRLRAWRSARLQPSAVG